MVENPKTIIFCAPSDFGLFDVIKHALQEEGFIVYDYPVTDSPYKYKNIYERLQNTYRKVFFRDHSYKRRLKMAERNRLLLNKRNSLPNATYALIIRPDLFPFEFVSALKTKVEKMVGYQWDGLQRFPHIFDYINLFDRFFVFDAKDLSTKNTLPTTNFFFKEVKSNNIKISKQITFTGSYFISRNEVLREISSALSTRGIQIDISIFTTRDQEIVELKKWGFKHIDIVIPYQESLKKTISSEFLLDVHINEHQGLSFRVFEAMYYEKKIITTNTTIKQYDFYNENNIFVWGDHNIDRLEDFLSTPYLPINEKIKEKYSFGNWINYLLDHPPHQKIDLPFRVF